MSTTQQEQTRAAAPQEYLLEMRGITKAFAGVQALKGVDFYVRPGTVHALMGENGAGKSTLMKCLFGIYHKDEGTIKLRGQEVNFQSPHEALLNGISMVHQELEQVPERSVMENVWLGRFPKKFGLIDTAKMVKDTEAVLATLGGEVKIDPPCPAFQPDGLQAPDGGYREGSLLQLRYHRAGRADFLFE